MTVLIYHRKGCPIQKARLKRSLEALLPLARKTGAQLEISLVGTTKIRQLNAQYRQKDKVTDVLSFLMEEQPSFPGAPWILGEIIIATQVAKQQARKAGRSLTQQVTRLAVHGLVHLTGMDHELGSKQKRDFERRETKYLNLLDEQGHMKWDGLLQL